MRSSHVLPIKVLALIVLAFCSLSAFAADSKPVLTDAEKKDGWTLLFDGETSAGWKKIGEKDFPKEGWEIADGCLHRKSKGGDLVTTDAYENFELALEWKIVVGANSGVKYRVADVKGSGFGPEYQILDDAKEGVEPNSKTATGSIYELFGPNDKKKMNPIGEWNSTKIVVNGNHAEHWLNGEKVVEYEFFSDAWKAAVETSKFKGKANYGAPAKGHILLQDHGGEVWFRNIKIKVLPAK